MRALLITLSMLASLFACQNNHAGPVAAAAADDKTARNEAIIRQYYQHFNNHEWDKMAAMYTDTAEMKDPSLGTAMVKQTPAEIEQKYRELNEMFPDVHDEVKAIYHAGDQVVVEFVSTGTAPDQSKFELPICTIFTIKDGKISGDFTYYDNFE